VQVNSANVQYEKEAIVAQYKYDTTEVTR